MGKKGKRENTQKSENVGLSCLNFVGQNKKASPTTTGYFGGTKNIQRRPRVFCKARRNNPKGD